MTQLLETHHIPRQYVEHVPRQSRNTLYYGGVYQGLPILDFGLAIDTEYFVIRMARRDETLEERFRRYATAWPDVSEADVISGRTLVSDGSDVDAMQFIARGTGVTARSMVEAAAHAGSAINNSIAGMGNAAETASTALAHFVNMDGRQEVIMGVDLSRKPDVSVTGAKGHETYSARWHLMDFAIAVRTGEVIYDQKTGKGSYKGRPIQSIEKSPENRSFVTVIYGDPPPPPSPTIPTRRSRRFG